MKSIVLLKNDLDGAPLLPLAPAGLRRVAVLGRLAATPNLGDRGSSNVDSPVCRHAARRASRCAARCRGHLRRRLRSRRGVSRGAQCRRRRRRRRLHLRGRGRVHRRPARATHGDGAAAPRAPTRHQPAAARSREPRHGAISRPVSRPAATAARSISPRPDQALIRAATAANPATVVVLMGGSAILVEEWHERAGAILMLWYPGMEGGRALADILLGRASPSRTPAVRDPARSFAPAALRPRREGDHLRPLPRPVAPGPRRARCAVPVRLWPQLRRTRLNP